jgi:glycosyltransferase involved in cell wall biosynthesis
MVAASVIIPCHNKRETLAEVLSSLERQSVSPDAFEVIVVDDASTDGTPAMVRARAGRRPRIALEEMGAHTDVCPARVRNRGLERARGQVAIFLDADVLVGPDFIREHLAAHAAGEGVVIGYIYAYPLAASERAPEVMQAPPIGECLERLPALVRENPRRWRDGREAHYRIWPDIATCPMPWLYFWGGNTSVSRKLVLEAGGFDETFIRWGFEDVELGYRLWRRGIPYRLQRSAWGFHYPHPTGSDERRFENMRQFLRKHPEPFVELNTFASTHFQQPGAARVRWEMLDRLATAPTVAAPPLVESGALLRWARTEGGPIAWFGELPAGVVERPALVSRPFQPRAQPGEAALAGLALPDAGPAFSTALLVDYWTGLSDSARGFLCAEVTRVAGRCVFAALATPPATVAPGPAYQVTTATLPGAHLQIVRRAS